ncbi:MAG TPA: YbaN family protein [Acidimicrobiales bacterium]|nr:YbaN family protein [Acidimicrobiales bacterium]
MSQPPLLRRLIWVPVGLVCVGVGGIGIVVPGLPSTVFFIAAAWAFSRSSPRLERWLLDLPTIGPLVRDYRAGLGMPQRAKVVAIAMLVVAVGISAFTLGPPLVSAAVLALGAVGVVVILRVPTRPDDIDIAEAG